MKVGKKAMMMSLLLLFIIPLEAQGQFNRVMNIFAQEIDTVTAITITTDEKAQYSTFMMDAPAPGLHQMLVVDIHGAVLSLQGPAPETPVGPLSNVRSSQWLEEPAVVRIVADMRSAASYRLEQIENQLYVLFTNYPVMQVEPPVEMRREVQRPAPPPSQQQFAVSNLNIRGQTIGQVIEAFMRLYDMNIITSKSIDRNAVIDVMIKEFNDPVMLFETILIANDYKYVKRDNIFLVTGQDVIIEDEYDFHIFKLKYLDANDIIGQLEPLISEQGQVMAYSRRPMGSTDLDIPTGTSSGGGGGAAAGGAGASGGSPLQGFTEVGVSEEIVEGKERSNTLLVYETVARVEKIKKVVDALDKPATQVNISVKVVETSLGENEKWGVNWTAIIEAVGAGGQATGSGMQQAGGGGGGAAGTPEGTIIPGIQLEADNFRFGTLSFTQFKAVMQLLETQEDSKLLNQPSVTTLDNQQANIAVGSIIPVEVTQIASAGGAGGGASGGGGAGGAGGMGVNYITTIQQQTVAISLSVIPQVNEFKYITLYVKPVVQEITGFTGSNGELPITSTRTTTTQVRVKDGDVIIIGGLIKEDKLKVQTRVKFLHRIPFLGNFFKHTRIETSRSELVIFITPNIIKDHAVIDAIQSDQNK